MVNVVSGKKIVHAFNFFFFFMKLNIRQGVIRFILKFVIPKTIHQNNETYFNYIDDFSITLNFACRM